MPDPLYFLNLFKQKTYRDAFTVSDCFVKFGHWIFPMTAVLYCSVLHSSPIVRVRVNKFPFMLWLLIRLVGYLAAVAPDAIEHAKQPKANPAGPGSMRARRAPGLKTSRP